MYIVLIAIYIKYMTEMIIWAVHKCIIVFSWHKYSDIGSIYCNVTSDKETFLITLGSQSPNWTSSYLCMWHDEFQISLKFRLKDLVSSQILLSGAHPRSVVWMPSLCTDTLYYTPESETCSACFHNLQNYPFTNTLLWDTAHERLR